MPGKTIVPLESMVVDWLLELINSETLASSINDLDLVADIVVAAQQSNNIRSFSIDYVSRLASARAAQYVVDQLGLLELVSVNTSISLTTGEVLRPDIICFNAESRTLVVFEVKREASTERQTVTELAAYEQELRNMLPFLGNFDVCFIVVARNWTTLLDHAVGGLNAWSGKQCLALRLDVDGDDFSLRCHLPEAWHLTGGVHLPPEALQTIDLFLVESASEDGEEGVPRAVMTAIAAIARAGDRAGSHGFLMLWDDVRGSAAFDRGRWAITLCAIDSLVMYEWCRNQGMPLRESETGTFLAQQASESTGRVPDVVYRIAKEAFPLLTDRYDPEFDGSFEWNEKVRQYRTRGVPIMFEFWGLLGDYAREFVCHEGVRQQYMPFISHSELDWTDPDVAIPLIEMLTGNVPFSRGLVTCTDSFNVGATLGNLVHAAHNAAQSDEQAKRLRPWVRWAEIEALRFAVEMKQIYDVTAEVVEPIPTLTNDPERRLESTVRLINWVHDELIGSESSLHQGLFRLGCDGVMVLASWVDGVAENLPPAHVSEILERARSMVGGLMLLGRDLGSATSIPEWNRLLEAFSPYVEWSEAISEEELRIGLDKVPQDVLIECVSTVVLAAADRLVPAVLHTALPMPPIEVDWEYLKKGARASFEAGFRWHAVILSQNGNLGGGHLGSEMTKLLTPISDPELEVYFLDEASSFSFARKVTWAELEQKGFLQSTRNYESDVPPEGGE